jgi:hypothetical protein
MKLGDSLFNRRLSVSFDADSRLCAEFAYGSVIFRGSL